MGWTVFIHLTVVFCLLYIVVPVLVRGLRPCAEWQLATAEAFVLLSFLLHFSIFLLGLFHLAQPGAVIALYLLLMLFSLLRRTPGLLGTSADWNAFITRVLLTVRDFHVRFKRPAITFSSYAVAWLLLLTAFLAAYAWFPIYNLRFTNADNYSRAISLAVMSTGQQWEPDSSIPLLIPLRFMSAASAPAVIAFSGPLFGAIFAIAAGFLVWQYTHSRHAAILGSGFAMIAMVWGISAEPGGTEMAAAFALLAFGLVRRTPSCAVMAALVAVSISRAFWPWLLVGVGCAVVAGLGSTFVHRVPPLFRRGLTAVGACACIVLLCTRLSGGQQDGPYQYEAAARVCDYVARNFARNTWMVVSPAHELPYLYGRGWHLELTDFVSSVTPQQVANSSYRFPYAVRDVFFFIEREPLSPGGSVLTLGSRTGLDLTQSYEASFIAYTTPLGRATLEYRAGELLAAYASTHGDLETIHSDGRLAVYHIKLNSNPEPN